MKKISRLIGLKKSDFDNYVNNNKISLTEARLIPVLKTGDEMALTSILMASIRLIKEFRRQIFKEIKLKTGKKAYFYTEVCFKEVNDNARIDGLILIVSSGVIQDALFIEVKNGNECGMGIKNYKDIKAGDKIEVYDRKEESQSM